MDYGLWARGLSHEDVLRLFTRYNGGQVALEQAFQDRFDAPIPEALNTGHVLTIVAAEVDAATERIVEYLTSEYRVPINVVFFRYFQDGDRSYLARSWLIDQARVPAPSTGQGQKSREPWNFQDWYVSFGEEPVGRSWTDAQKYGFVSAGGGEWFSRTIRALPVGARVFVHIPKAGYVGVGDVLVPAARFVDAEVQLAGEPVKLAEQPDLVGTYTHSDGDEWVVPVRWTATRPRSEAFWRKGMFANQNSAAKLRNRFTLDLLIAEFGLSETVDQS